MGAWGCGNLENDDALDWLGRLVEGSRAAPAMAILREAGGMEAPPFLDAPEACVALAAAEVAAAAAGRPHPLLPAQVARWLDQHPLALDGNLLATARLAVRNIRENSELQELWEEVGAEGWYAALDELEGRLRG